MNNAIPIILKSLLFAIWISYILSNFFFPLKSYYGIGREVWLPRFMQGKCEGVLEFRIAELLLFSINHDFGEYNTALYWDI